MAKSSRIPVIPGSYFWNLALKCMLIFSGGLILMAVVFHLTNQQNIGPTYGAGFRMLSELREEIFYKSIIIYITIVLLMLIGIVIISLFYSHRVAGPVYRLSLFAGEIRTGHLENDVCLRQGDVVHPLADEMNKMVDGYRRTVEELKLELAEIAALRENMAEGDGQQAIDEISKRAVEIQRLISKYQL